MSEAVIVTAPAISRRLALVEPGSAGTRNLQSAKTTMPIGRLTRKIQCQLRAPVKTPPRITPLVPPPDVTNPKIPMAFARSEGSRKRLIMSESASASTTAPPRPWTALATMSISGETESPQTRDASVKNAIPRRNRRRCPKRSPSLPPSRRKPPKVSMYALTTHTSEVAENPRSALIDGRATFTIVTSRTIIKTPRQSTRRANHFRRPSSISVEGIPP